MESEYRQACDDLIALLNRTKAASMAVAEEQDMTPMQVFVLYSIHLRGELAMGKLATFLHCDASNVTGLVDRLVAQQLITRQESKQDRRAKTLRLTTKGQRTIESVMAALPVRLGCDRLTASEREVLHTIIQKITR